MSYERVAVVYHAFGVWALRNIQCTYSRNECPAQVGLTFRDFSDTMLTNWLLCYYSFTGRSQYIVKENSRRKNDNRSSYIQPADVVVLLDRARWLGTGGALLPCRT